MDDRSRALADIVASRGEPERALALLDRADALEPGGTATRQVRAAVLVSQGKLDEAGALLKAP